jgi:hypothetical protein
VHAEAGWSIFQLPSGRSDFVEVFGPENKNASVFPAEVSEGIVVAFAVNDIVGAREELAAAKVELIGELVWANELFDDPAMEGFGWSFSVGRWERLRHPTGQPTRRNLTCPGGADPAPP